MDTDEMTANQRSTETQFPTTHHAPRKHFVISSFRLGQTNRLRCNLDPWQSALFALLPEKIAEEALLKSLSK